MTVVVEVEERELLELVVCAFVASEVESAFDLARIEHMPAPFPSLLARVRAVHDHFVSLDFPYDAYPDGWEASLLR